MRGRWLWRLALVLTGLLLPVVGLECGLETLGPALSHYVYVGIDTRRNLSYFELHPIYGGFHIPNTTTWQWTPEYVTRVDINSRGLREREIGYEKPAGVRRVLVLGDSLVEGAEVAVEEALPRRLEALLNESGAQPVQVLNAGVVGFGTAQEYLLLKHELMRYRPDIVVLVFFSGNDVSDNSEKLDYAPIRKIKPYFETDGNGGLRALPYEMPAPPSGPARELRERLRRASLLFSKLDPDELAQVPWERGYIDSILLPYASSPSRDVDDAWHVTEALLRATRDEAEAGGARFVLVNAPAPWEIDPPFWDQMRWYFGLPADGWDLGGPDRRLAEIVARQSFDFLDLRPELSVGVQTPPRLYYPIDGHWTSAGHDFVAHSLVRSGLLSTRQHR